MNRRRFLGSLGGILAVGMAGCQDALVGQDRDVSTPSSPDPAPTAAIRRDSDRVASLADADLPLDESDLERGAAKDAIPAIDDPAFGPDWSNVDSTLSKDDRVIGVTAGGNARAYPLPILNWHEVVNDNFGGPLLVTYCPLCGSSITADRLVNDEPTIFGVSGYLWKNDLVMYDEATDSLWSQVLAKAVRGPKTGEPLALRASTLTTWQEWQDTHPDTEVLLPPPESDTVVGAVQRDYGRDPYASYDESSRIGISGGSVDGRLHPKKKVIGVATDETARAYPVDAVRGQGGVVNDTVGSLPVVVASTAENSLVAYERTVEGTTLEFERDGDALAAGGSRWALLTGQARDGPYEGTFLRQANDRSPMFWFAWADFYPETEIYGQD